MTIYINPNNVTPRLAALFDPYAPAGLRCFSVLAGSDSERILTDDPHRPTWGAVWEAGDGTLYLGGAPDEAIVRHLVDILRHDGDVLVGFWSGDPLEKFLPPDPDYVGAALEFLDRSDMASAAVARKLGYRTEKQYQLRAWFKSKI